MLDECGQPVSHVVLLGDRAKISKRSGAFLWLEIIDDRLFQVVDGIDEVLFPTDPAPQSNIPKGEIDEDERDVDERDGRLIEIVVVARDELAYFVDESSESDSANERGPQSRSIAEEGETGEQRSGHQQASPKHVGDVKSRAAQAWIAGNPKNEPDRENG